MYKASDFFRQMVGDNALRVNAAARSVYESLRGMEDHHAQDHKDCEDAALEQLRLAMAGLYEKPVEIPERAGPLS